MGRWVWEHVSMGLRGVVGMRKIPLFWRQVVGIYMGMGLFDGFGDQHVNMTWY